MLPCPAWGGHPGMGYPAVTPQPGAVTAGGGPGCRVPSCGSPWGEARGSGAGGTPSGCRGAGLALVPEGCPVSPRAAPCP